MSTWTLKLRTDDLKSAPMRRGGGEQLRHKVSRASPND
jgi:hypothetical protein